MTPARQQPLVLLAEDFEDARELYRDYLEFSGFDVKTANNGREAIEQAIALQPDLILMDASMPVLDGWQATRELKGNPATRHIPVLALTRRVKASGTLSCPANRVCARIMSERNTITGSPHRSWASRSSTSPAHLLVA